MDSENIESKLNNCANKKQCLMAILTSVLEKLYKYQDEDEIIEEEQAATGSNSTKSPPATDFTEKSLNKLYSQLIEILSYAVKQQYYVNIKERDMSFMTRQIQLQFSQTLTTLLTSLYKYSPGKVYDSSMLFSNIFCEEKLPDIELDSNKKKISKIKKNYQYTELKHLCAVSLISIIECYGEELSSLIPLILNGIFKNLKKMDEKIKYFHCPYAIDLMKLLRAIIHNCDSNFIKPDFIRSFHKIYKDCLVGVNTDRYPIEFVSTAIDLAHIVHYGHTAKHGHLVEELFVDLMTDIDVGFKTCAETRLKTAKMVSYVLFHYKNIGSLRVTEVLAFYSKYFTNFSSREIKIGCIESIVQFFMLNLVADPNFLKEVNYLKYLNFLNTSVFGHLNISTQKLDLTSRYLDYFDHLNSLILPYISESSKKLIIAQIFEKKLLKDTAENLNQTLVYLGFTKRLLKDLSTSFSNDDQFIVLFRQQLLKLCKSKNFQIRIESNVLLKEFLRIFPDLLTEVLESSLTVLDSNFSAVDNFDFATNHGYSMLIANFMEIADKDYVSSDLVMKITLFATSYLKKGTLSIGTTSYYKELITWIILTGLMNYKDKNFLKMQKSQLFLFWKNVLTNSTTYNNEDELYKILEIRNHALTCLLAYLNNEDLVDKETAREVSQLLSKCSSFNNQLTIKSKTIDNALLYNEHRILQVYLKIKNYVKHDFNSVILILILKNFSDPNLYKEMTSSVLESIKALNEKKKRNANVEEANLPTLTKLLRSDDGFAYGLTSLVSGNNVGRLCQISNAKERNVEAIKVVNWINNESNWYYQFEDDLLRPSPNVLSYDYLILLYNGSSPYSSFEKYSPKITTSLINYSMDIFSEILPFLNDKIQFSVLESLNSFMVSKNSTPERLMAIALNTCIALNNALLIAYKHNIGLDSLVGRLLLEMIKTMDIRDNELLIKINADSVGLLSALVDKKAKEKNNAFGLENINICIKNIVDNEDCFFRVFNGLSLASIYKYNPQFYFFNSIVEILKQLSSDPHPVVHTWSLDALALLLTNHTVVDATVLSDIAIHLETLLLDDKYGSYTDTTWKCDYYLKYNSNLTILYTTKVLSDIAGPGILDLSRAGLTSFKNCTYASLNDFNVYKKLISLDIFKNMFTFKMDGVFPLSMISKLAKWLLNSSVFIGCGTNETSNFMIDSTKQFFPITTCTIVIGCIYDFYEQLIRLDKFSLMFKEVEYMTWVLLSWKPNNESVLVVVNDWISRTYENDLSWFEKLYQLINTSENKILSRLYRRYDKLLKDKNIKIIVERDTKVEEEKSISEGQNHENRVDIKAVEDNDGNNNGNNINGNNINSNNNSNNGNNNSNNSIAINASDNDTSKDFIGWRFKYKLLILLNNLVHFSQDSSRYHLFLFSRLDKVVQIAFLASAMNVTEVRELGIDILGFILSEFKKEKDESNPHISCLLQHQAQITSAIMPAFSRNTPISVIMPALEVLSQFIYSEVAPLPSLEKLTNVLVNCLVELSLKSNDSIKIVDVSVKTESSRKKLRLVILDAWAQLKINGNEEVQKFVDQYLSGLIPLWIIALREYAMEKYSFVSEKNSYMITLPDTWLNLVDAIGCVAENNYDLLCSCLSMSDLQSFMFVLYAECMESLMKNFENPLKKTKVLQALHKILQCHVLSGPFFEDDIHHECVNILERLVLTGSKTDKMQVVEIITDLSKAFIAEFSASESAFLSGVDNLYELFRILFLIVSNILPFIKEESNLNSEIELNDFDFALTKKIFGLLADLSASLPAEFRLDLFSCLLFIATKIIANSTEAYDYVAIVLPMMKTIFQKNENKDLVGNFYNAIKFNIFNDLPLESGVVTFMIFVSNNFAEFTEKDLDWFCNKVLSLLNENEVIAMQIIKSLSNNDYYAGDLILKNIINKGLLDNNVAADITASTLCELMYIFVESRAKINFDSAILLGLLYFDKLCETHSEMGAIVRPWLTKMASLDISRFQEVVKNKLPPEVRERMKQIIKDGISKPDEDEKDKIQLKSFT
ncbi:AP-1 complex accessory protein LAA1 SCDLUD_004050 [Saccharomycodes ludwigii]|uniref:AP-1 complex accessory protein LAA1 n=1 Tax=Saccharomycodes ludwigii TaxID=36035 RepID=UPI001E83ED18|nr:hypothetical protein SCDLUD_004050 [Saccharomycodes ludwigii]KAH3899762.1 hypothetical protein SCDLUD_004050 [Saccharomycodes ludwigii]